MTGSLELGSSHSGLSRSGRQVHLLSFPLSRTLSSPPLFFLPWLRRLGERRRHLSCLRTQPFAGDERILQVCPPLLFPSAVRDGASQTLTKLFVFGSESSHNILPTNFDFVCKNYRVYNTCAHPCPMLTGEKYNLASKASDAALDVKVICVLLRHA